MKKILFLIISAVLIIAVVIAIFVMSVTGKSVMIDGNYIDNVYTNNVLSNGNLLRIDDKLYYNYYSDNFFKYGLYEISEDGTNRVYSPKFVYFPYQAPLFSMQSFNNELLVGTPNTIPHGIDIATENENFVYSLNINTKELYISDILNDFREETILYYHIFNDIIYIVTKDNIYVKIDDNYQKVLELKDIINLNYQLYSTDDNFGSILFSYNKIYYFSSKNSCFCCYDIQTNKSVKLFETEILNEVNDVSSIEDINYDFFIVDNYFVFSVSIDTDTSIENYFYKVDLSNPKVEAVGKSITGYTLSYNFYKDKLFVGTEESGLKVIDINSNEETVLYKNGIEEIYILDDKYVYFIKTDKSLCRIQQIGENLERIFS